MTQLPPVMETLFIINNEFSGFPDLTKLPLTIVEIRTDENAFSGSVDFGHLARSL